MFFNYRTSNFNVSARITTQYNHKTKVPEAITNIICLSFSELENSVFLDLVLLRFTPATSYSFSGPSCQASQLHCHVHVSEFFFPVEFNRAKKPTLALSSFSFSEINKALDTKEHNWWRVLIFLSQQLKIRSDLSSSLGYSTGNPTLSHVQLSNARITSNACFEGWNKFSIHIWSPWEPILTNRRQLSPTEEEGDFLPLPVRLLAVRLFSSRVLGFLVQ